MNNFIEFPKIPRLNREVIITEKIDGTNAQVFVWDEGYIRPTTEEASGTVGPRPADVPWLFRLGSISVAAGSKNRWLSPGKQDNFGFAGWVDAHAAQLTALGHGRHFGEWWGQGIQRTYGLKEKRFSLFNVGKWAELGSNPLPYFGTLMDGQSQCPQCCHVVPTLYRGPFDTAAVKGWIGDLQARGSLAAPGFKKPEGIIVFHTAANHCFKVTLENDEKPKGAQ